MQSAAAWFEPSRHYSRRSPQNAFKNTATSQVIKGSRGVQLRKFARLPPGLPLLPPRAPAIPPAAPSPAAHPCPTLWPCPRIAALQRAGLASRRVLALAQHLGGMSEEYDLVTIGAGSGGVRASRLAAGLYGAKVLLLLLLLLLLLPLLLDLWAAAPMRLPNSAALIQAGPAAACCWL